MDSTSFHQEKYKNLWAFGKTPPPKSITNSRKIHKDVSRAEGSRTNGFRFIPSAAESAWKGLWNCNQHNHEGDRSERRYLSAANRFIRT